MNTSSSVYEDDVRINLESLCELEERCMQYAKAYHRIGRIWRGFHYGFSTIPFLGPIAVGVVNILYETYSKQAGIAAIVFGGVSGMISAYRAGENSLLFELAGDKFDILTLDIHLQGIKVRTTHEAVELTPFYNRLKDLVAEYPDVSVTNIFKLVKPSKASSPILSMNSTSIQTATSTADDFV